MPSLWLWHVNKLCILRCEYEFHLVNEATHGADVFLQNLLRKFELKKRIRFGEANIFQNRVGSTC